MADILVGLVADDAKAWALASRSTASSSVASYIPLYPLFLSAIVLISSFLGFIPLHDCDAFPLPGCDIFPLPDFVFSSFYCLLSAPWLLVQVRVSTVDSLLTFLPSHLFILILTILTSKSEANLRASFVSSTEPRLSTLVVHRLVVDDDGCPD